MIMRVMMACCADDFQLAFSMIRLGFLCNSQEVKIKVLISKGSFSLNGIYCASCDCMVVPNLFKESGGLVADKLAIEYSTDC